MLDQLAAVLIGHGLNIVSHFRLVVPSPKGSSHRFPSLGLTNVVPGLGESVWHQDSRDGASHLAITFRISAMFQRKVEVADGPVVTK